MCTLYFQACQNLDDARREYKRLALIHHPDRGGDTATMQEINRQYEHLLRNPYVTGDQVNQDTREDFIRFQEIIEQIIRLDITIEVCGNWIWLSGNTIAYKDELKRIGFFFAPKKGMWYWRPKSYKANTSKPMNMDYIRSRYGSDVIINQKDRSIKDEEART